MMMIMMPLFFLAMYEKHGQPAEVIAKQFIETTFLRPKVRLYETNCMYASLGGTQSGKEAKALATVYQKETCGKQKNQKQ